MSCFGCFGGLQPEAKLLNDCYPPPKALLTSGPEYKPLSSDLSKLTYRCLNQSSKLAKVGEELEKRVAREAARSTAGHAKSRASLLISLSILRALISECRRDLSLFARYIIRIVSSALDVKVYQKGDLDLEVIGRAASCFIAFTTYAENASAIGVDDTFAITYLTVLGKFAFLATTKSKGALVPDDNNEKEPSDQESVNRTRLIGLAALNGASSSDTLFSSNIDFKKQAAVIIPALLVNIFEGGSVDHLKLETAKITMDASPSPYFSELSARKPTLSDKRAPSLHAHIPGEKGPLQKDVLSAALRSLHALVRQCQVNQALAVMDSVSTFLDKVRGWSDIERCCWLAEQLASFVMLQYRFVVPTRLVESLIELEDKSTPKHTTLIAMATTILNSAISLVGLGVTDLLNNLVQLIIRRIHVDDKDGLLPPLVQCISSLGTHIYYADQINDVIEELSLRIAEIPTADKSRSEILRVLIHAIIGVMTTTQSADVAEARATPMTEHPNKGKAPASTPDPHDGSRRIASGRRNPISPAIWQETLPLLCESAYSVRAAYSRALLLYVVNELPRNVMVPDSNAKTSRKEESVQVYRFCNAVHAALYTLAMSSCLGSPSDDSSPKGSPVAAARELNDAKVSFNITEPTPVPTPNDSTVPTTGASTPTARAQPRRSSRRVSLPLNRLNSATVLTSFDNVATPFDFAAMIMILQELNVASPEIALITGVPMLLALDRDAAVELVRRPGDGRSGAWVLERKRSIKEVVTIVWKRLGTNWGIASIIDMAVKAMNSLPEPFEVPNPPQMPEGILPPPEEAVQFYQNTTEGESSTSALPLLNPEALMSSLVTAPSIQSSSRMDEAALRQRWSEVWTVESALKNSVERFSVPHVKPSQDTHFDVANALMSMNNASYQSFNRPPSRAIDVTDLREALGGRVDTIPLSGTPSLVSTAGGRSMREENGSMSPKRRTGNTDVQEVLKDIFKTKKRGGVKKSAITVLKADQGADGPGEKADNGRVNGDQGAPELGRVVA